MAVESSTKFNIGKGVEIRGAGTSKGMACTATAAAFTQFPLNTARITATPRLFATAVVVRMALNPWLVVLKTTDNMAGYPTDYSNNAQDNSTSTEVDVSSLSTLANGDFLLIGSHIPFRGVYIDVNGTNSAGTATMTSYYWNGGTWVDSSATVTGVRTTMIFDKDGIVTWTVPAPWKPLALKDHYQNLPAEAKAKYYATMPLYWMRWDVDAAITDTSVTFYAMSAANRSTAYFELAEGQSLSADIQQGVGGIGCIEAVTDAGTASLVVNAISKGTFV